MWHVLQCFIFRVEVKSVACSAINSLMLKFNSWRVLLCFFSCVAVNELHVPQCFPPVLQAKSAILCIGYPRVAFKVCHIFLVMQVKSYMFCNVFRAKLKCGILSNFISFFS